MNGFFERTTANNRALAVVRRMQKIEAQQDQSDRGPQAGCHR